MHRFIDFFGRCLAMCRWAFHISRAQHLSLSQVASQHRIVKEFIFPYLSDDIITGKKNAYQTNINERCHHLSLWFVNSRHSDVFVSSCFLSNDQIHNSTLKIPSIANDPAKTINSLANYPIKTMSKKTPKQWLYRDLPFLSFLSQMQPWNIYNTS